MSAKRKGIAKGVVEDLKRVARARNQRVSSGNSQWSLGTALVVSVDYKEHTVGLRTLTGQDQTHMRTHIPITYPGGGSRGFFGYMPMVGDRVVVGQLAQESSGYTTTPVILGYVPPASWLGHDWLMSSSFSPDEVPFNPKNKNQLDGTHQRVRHKLRHIRPGGIIASSAQGSDLVLDEGVTIANRRCNEIRLRDADQAIVARSLQQFHAMAGVRTYGGMVQRDATLLPTQMFSDGVDWEGRRQIDREIDAPYTDGELSVFESQAPPSFLTPDPVFGRLNEDGSLSDVSTSGVFFDSNVDPYVFLQRGLFITPVGYAFDDKVAGDVVYGGKPQYRTAVLTDPAGKPLNAAGSDIPCFTEHRVEVSHVSDGRLPVTEQTDNFDADRLPRTALTGDDRDGRSLNDPYVTVVYGTVVGNDPYSSSGRTQYGMPLKPTLFNSSGTRDAKMEAALVDDVASHAALLTQVTPPSPVEGDPTFWSVTKDGRAFFSVGGPTSEKFSLQASFASGINLVTEGVLRIEAKKGLELVLEGDSLSRGINLESPTGAVKIFGGGVSQEETLSRLTAPGNGGTASAPSLHLEGKDNVLVKGSRRVSFEAADMEAATSGYRVQALSEFSAEAGDRLGLNSKVVDIVSTGRASLAFSGPKDGLPTNLPLRSEVLAGLAVGVADSYLMVLGDRKEEFIFGNHSTLIGVGNLTYLTGAGAFSATASANSFTVDSVGGITATAGTGNVTLTSGAASVLISGTAAALIRTNGLATLSGNAGVALGASGGKLGPIICGSDLDPLTGKPLSFYLMGSPTHNLVVAV